MTIARGWSAAAICLLGWGVFALGASHPWGYAPLLAGMAVYGSGSFLRGQERGLIGRGLGVSLVALCGAVLLQLIPLPSPLLTILSPAATSRRPSGATATLSMDPGATALGFVFAVSLVLFFVGCVRILRRTGVRELAAGLVGLGTLVALTGIAEVSTAWEGMYRAAGLPLPPDSMPHGPFSSRNHYAAWMLMALAVSMGYLLAVLEQAGAFNGGMIGSIRAVSERDGGRSVAIFGALTMMAVALVQTRSRAGVVCFVIAVVSMAALLMRRHAVTNARLAIAALATLVIATGIAATGLPSLRERFLTDSWATAHGRLPIWRQAASIARDYPITGSGLNTYQSVVPLYASADLDEAYEGAHNDYIQLTAEGGLLIGIPVLATLGFFVRETRQRFREYASDGATRWIRIGAVVGLLLVALQETVDFGLQVPGNAALFAVLAAIAVHRAPRERRKLWRSVDNYGVSLVGRGGLHSHV